MKKFLIFMLILLGCAGTGFAGYYLASHKMEEPPVQQKAEVYSPLDNAPAVTGDAAEMDSDYDISEISFAACGDNLIHSYIYKQAFEREGKGGYDFSYCYKRVADLFKERKMNWINQETLVTDTLEPSSYPKFSSPGQVVRDLYDINFRLFSISNNHIYDQGIEGLTETEKFWDSMPEDTLVTGLVEKDKYNEIPIKTVDNIKFAFLSYTYGTNGLDVPEESEKRVITLNETDIIRKQIKKARKQADVVIVGCHWGIEDSHTVTESQREMAKNLTSWGADLIIGTHPHVLQDAEWVEAEGRKAFCAYSLGNFISGQDRPDNLIGAVLTLNFEVKEDILEDTYTVEIKKPKLVPVITDYRESHVDLRVYPLKDYSREMADTHGIRAYDSRFNYDYIYEVLKASVNKKFLKLPKKKKSLLTVPAVGA